MKLKRIKKLYYEESVTLYIVNICHTINKIETEKRDKEIKRDKER